MGYDCLTYYILSRRTENQTESTSVRGKEAAGTHLSWDKGMVWCFAAWVASMFCLCSDMITSGLALIVIYPAHRAALPDDVL